ncbi:MAG: hypothetical protein RXN77_07490 [Sulfolobaceae archaeon]|nr:hypothetical protein [Sulfolobales archaeon]
MTEEKYRSPFYYNMNLSERLVHDIISPYAAENMYWNRINMEMLNNMYQRYQEDYYDYYDDSTPGGDSKQGIITILVAFMYFFLMMLALSSLLNNHY